MRLLERIQALIATPSVSAVVPELDMPNRPVIDLLANWLDDEGFSVEVLPVRPDGKKANLVATLGRGPGGLVLSGHTDTVPFDEGKWQSDPFRATERDGFVYGLGSADMKSFFAVAIEAARRFEAEKLREPLIVLATADEECGMSGVRALVAAGRPKARHAVIGEPTGLRPIRMHKGVSMESIELLGRSGHSSDPALGRNALEGMRRAMNALVAYREELAHRHHRPDLHPPATTMNLGNIRGGDNPNRICAHCELQYDIRVLPGMDVDQVRGELHARVRAAIEGLDLTFTGGALHEPVPPFETPATAAIVRAAEELTGHAAGAVSFGTEAPFLSGMGMSTIVLGPGDIAVAHQPNERIELASLPRAVDVIAQLVERFCVSPIA
ncbi:MAG: acetylornithine deacetylase [Sandaracinaceae bacterium]